VQQIQSQAISDEVMGKKKTTFDLREVMPVWQSEWTTVSQAYFALHETLHKLQNF
jgi:hypothetical protein